MLLGLNNNNKKNYYEISTKPLKSMLKYLDGKGNRVIILVARARRRGDRPPSNV